MIDVHQLREALGPAAPDGAELGELAESLERRPAAAIRLRPECDPAELPFRTRRVPWHPRGYFVEDQLRPAAQLAFAAGQYYVQDAGSLLAVALLDPQPGELVCDVCAAPGGKATAILEEIGTTGWLLANETIRSRHGALRLNLARHGSVRYVLSQCDPQQLAAHLPGAFDAVLVDAPCTGQSLLARGRASASAFAAHQIAHSAARQRRILDAAARLVRSGGRLVYATCTFAYAENEGQVRRFLSEHDGWSLSADPRLSCWQSSVLPSTYRLWPHRDGCAGAFAARWVRGPAAEPAGARSIGRPPRREHPAQLPAEFSQWGRLEAGHVVATERQYWAWDEEPPADWLALFCGGPLVAFRKGSSWFPAYQLAMRRDPHWRPHRAVQLDDELARRYVAGRSLPLAVEGWAVATWRGHPLGWLKGTGHLAKNHLPHPARVTVLGG